MALTWQEVYGGHWHGFDRRGLLAANVVWYQRSELGEPDGDGLRRHRPTARFWTVFLSLHQLPGEWTTADEAKAAADEAHDAEGDAG